MWVKFTNPDLSAVKLPSMEEHVAANENGTANVSESDGRALIQAGVAEKYSAEDEDAETDADAADDGDDNE